MPEPIIEFGPDGRLRSLTLGPLKVEPPSSKRASKWRVSLATGGDGWDAKPGDGVGIMKVAKALGLTAEQVSDALRAGVANLEALAETPKLAEFTISTWGKGETKKKGPKHSHMDPLVALDEACTGGRDFISWTDTALLCAIDVDIQETRYTDASAIEAARLTGADRAWVTRSGGLRLIFVARDGMPALERALVGLALGRLPDRVCVKQVEVKSETRRPPGRVHRGHRCTGEVVARASSGRGGEVPDAVRDDWLDENGMEVNGGPYEHELCPIDPCRTSGNPPVNANEDGIWCYRCHGVYGSGFRWYRSLVDFDGEEIPPNELLLAARERVNLAHARLMLREEWPLSNIKDARERWVIPAWRGLIRATLKEPDPTKAAHVIASCLNPSNAWARAEGGLWVRTDTFTPIALDKDALRALPWTRAIPQRLALALDAGPLAGYKPVRLVRGALLRPDLVPKDVVALLVPRPGLPPIQVLPPSEVMPWAEAFGKLTEDYPGIDNNYLLALLVAAVCIEGGGQPPMIYPWGPTGSAKTTTIGVAAGLLGSEVRSVPRKADEEDWRRQIGQGLTSGARFLLIDEAAGMNWSDGERLRLLGEGGGRHTFRPLNGVQVKVPWRAVLVVTGRQVPKEWRRQPELGRRMRAIRLPRKVPRDWRVGPFGGPGTPIDRWRDEHPDEGNALLSHAAALAQGHGCYWDAAADVLGLLPIDTMDASDAAERVDAMRAFYAHLRNEDGRRVMRPMEASHKAGRVGWVDLAHARAQEVLKPLLEIGEHARRNLTNDLNGEDWERVLNLPGSQVRVEVDDDGPWVARAIVGGCMRGRELRNEACPPAGPVTPG